MATRRHAVGSSCFARSSGARGAFSSNGCQARRLPLPGCAVPLRPWSCSWRSGNGPAAGRGGLGAVHWRAPPRCWVLSSPPS